MKTLKTLSIIVFLFLTVPSQAQFKFGVTGGFNISVFHLSDDTYKPYLSNNRVGCIVGPTVVYDIPKTHLGLDASAMFDIRGAKSKKISNCEPVFCYSLQLPLNFRYGMMFGDVLYGFVFTGPQFGLNIGSKERLIISGTGETSGHTLERRWVNDDTMFSWNFGVGGVILENVQVRLSFNLALRDTGEIQQVDLVDGTRQQLTTGRAHACQVAVSYLF